MKVLALARKQIAAVPVLAVFIAVFAWGIGPLCFWLRQFQLTRCCFIGFSFGRRCYI